LRIELGDSATAGQLLPLVYDELRLMAGPGEPHDWDGRGHFFAAAAAMRRILVEGARRKQRRRHGDELARVDLDELNIEAPEPREDLLALDAALDRLKLVDPLASQPVQLRYFAGLTQTEAAEMLDLAPRTACGPLFEPGYIVKSAKPTRRSRRHPATNAAFPLCAGSYQSSRRFIRERLESPLSLVATAAHRAGETSGR